VSAALILAAGAASAAESTTALASGSRYVALGSSFAAGPGVSVRADDSPAGCSQSTDNYPRQLARRRGLVLVDRSCGGATTVHVLNGGQFGLPAQLDAITPDTRLVTVTIGGNDVRYMGDIVLWACANAPQLRPEAARAAPCLVGPKLDVEAAFSTLAQNMRTIAAETRRRAPQARLVFVDYVTVLPPSGVTCAALPLTGQQADELRARSARLAALTEQVARESGASLLKASDLTRGHEVCTADPWVEGVAYRLKPADFGPAAFHPKRPAMDAIASALDRMLN
jgi:lysophospholipase L1-like esterase